MNKKEQNLINHYQKLVEDMTYRIHLLEKMVSKKLAEKKKAAAKKAAKDYDGDGKIESSEQEWKGSRDAAIKMNMAKKAKKNASSKKKKHLSEGTIISDGTLIYGGFPRILRENNGLTTQYNDSGDFNQQNIATRTDAEEESLENLQSKLSSLEDAMQHLRDLREPGEYDPSTGTRGLAIRDQIVNIQDKIRKHSKNKRPVEQPGSSFFARRTPDPDALHDRWQRR